MNAVFLLCPHCEDAQLVKTEEGRRCPECEVEMTEVEYQIYHAKRAQQAEAWFKVSPRTERRAFGTKKKSDKA